MAPPQTLRKAYRAFKDSTKVGIAHVNSNYAELDVAIVKATSHVVSPPKERHLTKIIIATTVVPRVDVVYCIRALSRRLTKTHNWTVAMKTLIVLHRTLREGDPTFREELLKFSQKGRILKLSSFKDDSSLTAWDCSAGVRTYALFLEERLECFRVLKYDIESERILSYGRGREKGYSRTRDLNSSDLLEQLPALQHLLHRLIGCQPEGAVAGNCVIQSAFTLVLKESFNIYCAINDGIINLVDKFFEMSRHEAMKALDIYKRAGEQAGSLSDFYKVCRGLELTRNFQFPVLREPPRSFLATMEEYIREAPRVIPVPLEILESPNKLMLKCKSEESASSSSQDEETETSPSLDIPLVSVDDVPATASQPTAHIDVGDLLDLNVDMPNTSAIEDINAVPSAIIPNDSTYESHSNQTNVFDPTGWEFPLVTAPISSLSAATERQLASGLDTLTLDSLYNGGEYRAASLQPVHEEPAKNPFEVFQSSNYMTSSTVQIAAHTQLQQPNPFGPHHVQPSVMAPSNPFALEHQTSDSFSLNPAAYQQVNDSFLLNFIHQQVSDPLPLDHVRSHGSNPFGSTVS